MVSGTYYGVTGSMWLGANYAPNIWADFQLLLDAKATDIQCVEAYMIAQQKLKEAFMACVHASKRDGIDDKLIDRVNKLKAFL